MAGFGLLLPFLLDVVVHHAHADAPVGDVYVHAEPGAAIYVDGNATGVLTPGVVQGVAAGPHRIRVVRGCGTGTVDLAVRPNAVERVEVPLQAGLGTATVSTTPYGATLRENDLVVGSAPSVLKLTCGTHTFLATADGRQPTSYTFEVPLDGTVEVRIDLPELQLGAVALTVFPLDAEVRVDGETRGAGPMTLENLSPGKHRLRVSAPGHVPFEQDVDVLANQIARASFTLRPVPPKEPLARRMGLDRVPWGRVGLDAGATLASVGLGALAVVEYRSALASYGTYAELTYADDPDGFYDREIATPRTFAYALGIGSVVGVAGSTVLWATTDMKPRAATVGAGAGAVAAPPPTSATPSTPAPAAPPASPTTPAPTGPSLRAVPMPGGVLLTGRF